MLSHKSPSVSRLARLLSLFAAFASPLAYVSAQTLPALPAPPAPEPSTHINVLNAPYSAKGNGTTKDTTAVQNALNAAAATPGGAVVDFPGGHTYLIGSVIMASNVWLNVESGATIQGSDTASDYPMTTERWQGNDVSCRRGLIAADHVSNIAITGTGTIAAGATVGASRSPRGPALIEPRFAQGFLIENVTLKQHTMWTLHPTFCQDVTVSGVIFNTDGSNSDGIDPDSCTRMLIDHCSLTTHDDNIAIKSGKGIEGATVSVPTTDLTITNNTFIAGDASVTFGSECSGGVARVFMQNNTFGSGRAGQYFKTVEGRGGYYCDILADTNTYTTQVLEVNSAYAQNSDPQPVTGLAGVTRFNNITIRNATIHSSTDLALVAADSKLSVNNMSFSHWTGSSGSGITISNATNMTVDTATITVSGGSALSKTNVTAGLSVSPATMTVSPGGTATYSLTSQALSGTATLVVEGDGVTSGLPAGASASFSPSSISGTTGSSTLTVTTSSSTPVGTYCAVIQATAGSIAHTAAVTLVVGSGAPQAAAPSFSPGGGTYSSTQLVNISTATSGAAIRYTTDGSTPTETHGTVGGSVSITSTTTLKAIAYASGFSDSNVTSATYTITVPQTAAPVFSPGAGTYTNAQNVTISTTTSGATIRYTTDSSTPSETNGTIYSGAVNIASTTTLKAIAYASGFTDSTVTSGTYTINSGTGSPISLEVESLSPVGTGATVSISNDANASGGVVEFLNSTAAGQTMTLTTPGIPAGTYQVQLRYKTNTSRGQHNVVIDGTQVGGTIDQYATTSTYVTATLGNVTLATSGAHTIVLNVTGKNASASQYYITADVFTLTPQSSGPPPAATPVFSPAAGTYTTAQTVTISSSTGGASIRYTTDGSTPSETAGTLYSGPVSVSSSETLTAIAYESGFADSSVTSATYTISTGGGGTTVSFEAESLTNTPSGATSSVQTDTNSSGGKWVELAGNSVGDSISYAIPSVTAGTYQVQMEWKGNNSRGILQLSVDGTNLGPTLDQYSAAQSYPTTTFGTVTFNSAGTHTIKLTVTGKNSASSNYQLSSDKFTFVAQ